MASSDGLSFTFDPPVENVKKIRIDSVEFPVTWGYFCNDMFKFVTRWDPQDRSPTIKQFAISGRHTVDTLAKALQDGMNSIGVVKYKVENLESCDDLYRSLGYRLYRIYSTTQFQIMSGRMNLALQNLTNSSSDKPSYPCREEPLDRELGWYGDGNYYKFDFYPVLGRQNRFEIFILCFVINERVLIKQCYSYNPDQKRFVPKQLIQYIEDISFYEKDKLSDQKGFHFMGDEKTSFAGRYHEASSLLNEVLISDRVLPLMSPVHTVRVYADNMHGHINDFSGKEVKFTLQ